MFDLTGKTALVTGATGGLGGAICRRLREAGARLAISGTRAEALNALAAELGAETVILPCNLADAASVETLVPDAAAGLGRLDILVANAGVTRDGLLLRMKDEDWSTVMTVNLDAYFRLARAAAKIMLRQRSGRIVAITSVVGVTGNPGQANYAASKAGMIGFTKSLAQEIAARGVTANCVAPGFIASPMTDSLTEAQRDAILTRVPAGRLGTGDDVAAGVVYLASDAAAYVTGHTLHINGGMAMI